MTLSELRKIAEAATPGPWNHEHERYSAKNVIGIRPRDDRWIGHCQPEFNGHANAEYICTFNPQTVLAMIEEIELVRAFDNMNNIEDVDLELKKIDTARTKLDAILNGCEG